MGGLLEVDRLAGDQWDGLGHPRLSLDVGLLRVRSGALVEYCLVRIIGGSDVWESLYTPRVLLLVAAWTVVGGWAGIGRTASVVWGSPAVAVRRLIDRDRYTRDRVVRGCVWRDHHRARVEGDRGAASTMVLRSTWHGVFVECVEIIGKFVT